MHDAQERFYYYLNRTLILKYTKETNTTINNENSY